MPDLNVPTSGVSRRDILAKAATSGLLLAGIAASAEGQTPAVPPGRLPAVPPAPATPETKTPLPPLGTPSEREELKAPSPLPPGERIGVALVGLGRLTLAAILPAFGASRMVKPVALVSGDADKMKKVAAQYGIPDTGLYSYENFDSIKNNPDVQIVYIVLPNSQHREFTVRAARAGKHVLCEKPMATNVQDCEAMIKACADAGKKLMIAYRIQYEPHHALLRERVQGGKMGKIVHITSNNGQRQGDPEQWRMKKALAGGGAMPDVGIYCLNTIRYHLGEEPIEISAQLYSTPGDPRFREVEESVNWIMRFPTGVTATCATSYGFHETRTLRIMGEERVASMEPAFAYNNLKLVFNNKSESEPKAEEREEYVLDPVNQFAREMDHMGMCVMENKTPWTPGEEGLQDQRLIETIYRAAREGRTIKLPEIAKKDAFRGTKPDMD